MNTRQRLLLKDIYLMQLDDISRFTATLADVFPYSSTSAAESTTMTRWAYSGHCRLPFCQIMPSALPTARIPFGTNLCPSTKQGSRSILLSKKRGLKMVFQFGIRSIIRLLHFEAEAKRVAKRHQTANDGYLMAFATRIDKLGQHYGKPLIEALLSYLDASGEGSIEKH